MSGYEDILDGFARLGAAIINSDPKKRYSSIGRGVRRPLEPGFIPVDRAPKLVTVSLYPNETIIESSEYAESRASMEAWGGSGRVEDYKRAYADWVTTLQQIPFYRDFNAPIFSRVGIDVTEFAWLPLLKCPLPARTPIPEDELRTDRIWLWEQIYPLKPRVILTQGLEPDRVVRAMCESKFPHKIVLQRIGRIGTNEYHAAEDDRVVNELSVALTG